MTETDVIRVFLVDDQELLLDLAEVSLSNRGYRLRKFHDPAIALRCFRKARKKPDLLITDYAMGKMNGLGTWFAPVTIFTMLGTVGFYLYKGFRLR